MKLYYSPASCSLASQIALHEAGISHDIEKVDLKSHTTAGGADFYAINPKGYVPALELDDGSLLTEGTAILQYVADRAPDAALAPKPGTPERVRLVEWLGYVNSEVHKTMGGLFDGQMPAEYKEVQKQRIAKKLDWLNGLLAAKPYLMGAQYSIADAYLFVVLNWGQWVGVDIGNWPNLKAFMERVSARPAVVAALKAAGLIKG
jgi:glutathione S-transferase